KTLHAMSLGMPVVKVPEACPGNAEYNCIIDCPPNKIKIKIMDLDLHHLCITKETQNVTIYIPKHLSCKQNKETPSTLRFYILTLLYQGWTFLLASELNSHHEKEKTLWVCPVCTIANSSGSCFICQTKKP
ncbi:MAG: hypothetical protein AABY22_13785, partial [Nanoarchaeota archaeon]